MDDTRRRALITIVVAAIPGYLGIAGVGHAYLRQWRRSIVWFLLALGSAFALTFYYIDDPASIDIADPAAIPSEVTIPLLVIISLSVLDAFLLAISMGREKQASTMNGREGEDGQQRATPSCPNCGKNVDPELDFCPWCTVEFERAPAADDPELVTDDADDRP
ncbi:MAG: zinc ribbon domain-containing protein [Halobacteriota archaeon]